MLLLELVDIFSPSPWNWHLLSFSECKEELGGKGITLPTRAFYIQVTFDHKWDGWSVISFDALWKQMQNQILKISKYSLMQYLDVPLKIFVHVLMHFAATSWVWSSDPSTPDCSPKHSSPTTVWVWPWLWRWLSYQICVCVKSLKTSSCYYYCLPYSESVTISIIKDQKNSINCVYILD